MIQLTEDIDGNQFLEGSQPMAVKDLWETGKDYENTKTERMKLGRREKELKDELKGLYKKHPELFTPADGNPNLFVYAVAGLVIEVEREESFELKTHKEDAPPPISGEAQKNLDNVAPLKRGRKNASKDAPENIY